LSTTINLPLDTDTLVPARHSKRWGGFGNLLRKELGQWWGTKMWWIQALVYIALINGVSLIVAMDTDGMSPDEAFIQATRNPFLMLGAVIGIGVIITIQGAIIGERDHGTAAWVMSKPVSRASFVISKIVAHSFGFLVTAILVPSAVYAITSEVLFPGQLDYGAYARAVGVIVLAMLFYVTLAVFLGTVFRNRGPVAGIGIGFVLTLQFLNSIIPSFVVLRTPYALSEVAATYAANTTPQFNTMTPIIATAIGVVALTGLAVWRFSRDEF
jgi:ABC-2 type transport system permease protein